MTNQYGAMTNPVVEAVKASAQLKPGWHTAMIRFKLDDDGNLTAVDEYKVSSFGEWSAVARDLMDEASR